MRIWIVNPFDQLPNETDVPLRYWSLCRMLAEQGHEVIWWSSDFSHLNKTKREPCRPTDGFQIRLIETPTYEKNISLARLRNHRAYARKFYHQAQHALLSRKIAPPDRIIVSSPPLGSANSAILIRDFINQPQLQNKTQTKCQVIVDMMDAWPETFHRAFPKWIPRKIKHALLYPLQFSAKQAHASADKISGVGQTYLDLAQTYLPRNHSIPIHLCYHGADLSRFRKIDQKPTRQDENSNKLQVVCLGSMNLGYDLQTVVQAIRKCNEDKTAPIHLHFAGTGMQESELKKYCQEHQLLSHPTVVTFHGQLNKDHVNELLLSADLGLVANKSETLVACPYKAAEYAAAGLPILSCLGGELGQLIHQYDAGTEYREGDVDSLAIAFQNYHKDRDAVKRQSLRARKIAAELFDRKKTYAQFIQFILSE